MALRQPRQSGNPALAGTKPNVYQSSRGGWFKPADKPVPGTPKKERGK